MCPIKLSDVRPGSVLYPDAGFTCMDANTPKVVKRQGLIARIIEWVRFGYLSPGLFIECDCGQHDLNGQLDVDGSLAGLSLTNWVGEEGRQPQ